MHGTTPQQHDCVLVTYTTQSVIIKNDNPGRSRTRSDSCVARQIPLIISLLGGSVTFYKFFFLIVLFVRLACVVNWATTAS